MTFSPFPGNPRRPGAIDALADSIQTLWWRFRNSDFGRGLGISLVGVYAMILRTATTQYGRRSAGAVWVVIAPLLRLGGMILLFSYLGRGAAAGDSLVIFFMTGLVPVFLIRHAISKSATAIRSAATMLAFPQIGVLEVVAARVWLELITDIVMTVLIIMAAKAFGDLPVTAWFKEPLELVGALSMLAYLVFGISMLSAQIGRLWQQWTDVTRLTGRVLIFTSGIWYTMDSLPPDLRSIVQWNPLAHVVEWIRDASIHGFEGQHFSMSYPFWFATVCLFVGLFINLMYRIGGYDVEPGV